MLRDFDTVHRATDIWEVARLLSKNKLSGVPVVDDAGIAVGVISQTDIVAYLKDTAARLLPKESFYEDAESGPRPQCPHVTAGEIMTAHVIQASEDALPHELSRMMLERRVHRIIITRNGKPCGIVSTLDLLKFL
ncbi:MAG TPA: CBS domain-containing protein [Elusimicrobiota bacterium]|nr:CBS domain-containing protein [Elusimicrobiota bacterium]